MYNPIKNIIKMTKGNETTKVEEKNEFLNVDGDIETMITKNNVITPESLQIAMNKIQERNKAAKAEEAATVLMEGRLAQCLLLLIVRLKGGERAIIADKLKAITSLNEEFSKGGMKTEDYFEKKLAIEKTARDAGIELSKKHMMLKNQLAQQFTTVDIDNLLQGYRVNIHERVNVDAEADTTEAQDKALRVAANAAHKVEKK
jgi:hypothetical protein